MTRTLVVAVALLVVGIQAGAIIAAEMLLAALGIDVDEPLRDDRWQP